MFPSVFFTMIKSISIPAEIMIYEFLFRVLSQLNGIKANLELNNFNCRFGKRFLIKHE